MTVASQHLTYSSATLGLDVLRCQSPDLIEKEVWLQVIAYNLVRALMLEAAWTHDVSLERLSFKGTVDTLRQGLHCSLQGCLRLNGHGRNCCASSLPIKCPSAPTESNHVHANDVQSATNSSQNHAVKWSFPLRDR